jgi:hypothetical protein
MEGLTEAQIAGVAEILRAVLSSDNQSRKAHEAQLTQLRKEHPNELVLSLLYTLNVGTDSMLRALAAVLLRQSFSGISNHAIWDALTPQVQEASKKELLNALRNEKERAVSNKICDVVGELGASILSSKGKKGSWDELLPLLFEAAIGSDTRMASSALKIFSGLFVFLHKKLQSDAQALKNLFRTGFNSPDAHVKAAAVDAFGSLLSVLQTEEALTYGDLLPELLKTVADIVSLNEVDGKEALENLTDMADAETKYFKQNLALCYQLTEHILQKDVEDLGVKYMALEFIVTIAEKSSKLLQQNKEMCTQLVSLIFRLMTSIEYEIDEAWARPKEGFQDRNDEEDEEVDIDYVKRGIKLVARLVENIGDANMMPVVLPFIQQALSDSQDWRLKYSALMTMSELCAYISEPEKIAELVPIMTSHTTHAHPKIRYAAFQCIGQVSEDFDHEFQQTHHAAVVPVLLAGCDDSVPRVTAHCCAAICNFFSDAGETIAKQYTSAFVPKLIQLISPQYPSIVIESSVTALSAVAESCRESFGEYYVQMMPYLVNIIKSYKSDEYTYLRGRCIECMTLMCEAVGKDVFKNNAAEVIGLLRIVQEESLKSDSTLRSYILSGWQRICITLKEEFAPYLQEVLPGLLHLAGTHAEISISTEPETLYDIENLLQDDSKKGISVSTSDTEDKEVGLQTLLSIIDVMKGAFAPYVDSTIPVVFPLVEFKVNENVRATAASLLGSLTQVVAESGAPDAISKTVNLAKVFLGKLWEVAVGEFDSETLTTQLEAIRTVLESPNVAFLTAEEINVIGEKAIKILDDSIQRRLRNKEIEAEESDEEEDEFIQELNKKEEDYLHTAISEVLGAIFKTHTQFSLNIINFLYENVLSRFLAPEASSEDHKFGIFVIDDIIEFVGQEVVGDKWNAFCEAIARYASDSEDPVRQAAVYGLGIFASKTSPATFAQWSSGILVKLDEAIRLPVGKSKKTHGHARDNAIAALGRVIKYQFASIDAATIVPAWIDLLPLKYDKAEAKMMHDLLADLVLSNSAIVFGPDNSKLAKILHIFSEILETKFISEETVPKVKSIFQNVQAANYPGLQNIWSGLPDISRAKVSNLLAN